MRLDHAKGTPVSDADKTNQKQENKLLNILPYLEWQYDTIVHIMSSRGVPSTSMLGLAALADLR